MLFQDEENGCVACFRQYTTTKFKRKNKVMSSRTVYFGPEVPLPRRLRLAVIGGGPGAFIAQHHFAAIRATGLYDIVAGAPSRDASRCLAWGRAFAIHPSRVYSDWKNMLTSEAGREDRPDAILVLTETGKHMEHIIASLQTGFHVITDKPLTVTLEEALRVFGVSMETGKKVFTTFNHNTYGAVLQGQKIIHDRVGIGEIHTGRVQFLQSWGLTPVERQGVKQAWRFDEVRCCGPDIASHAERLTAFWLSQEYSLKSVSAECRTIMPNRKGDDMVMANLVYRHRQDPKRTVRVSLMAGEMCARHEDDLAIEMFGTEGSLAWSHLRPYELLGSIAGKEVRLVDGRDFQTPSSYNPPEHPTGFADTWVATYMGIAGKLLVLGGDLSASALPVELTVPTCSLRSAVESTAFVNALYESSKMGGEAVFIEELLAEAGIGS